MHSCIGCICSIFLHCVFSNVSLKQMHEGMHNHTGCICLTFLHCVFLNESLDIPLEKRHIHTGCICEPSNQHQDCCPSLQFNTTSLAASVLLTKQRMNKGKVNNHWNFSCLPPIHFLITGNPQLQKVFCLRDPFFWGGIFLILRRNFPNMEEDFPNIEKKFS